MASAPDLVKVEHRESGESD